MATPETVSPDVSYRVARAAWAAKVLRDELTGALEEGFHGRVVVTVDVQDGMVQTVRAAKERIFRP